MMLTLKFPNLHLSLMFKNIPKRFTSNQSRVQVLHKYFGMTDVDANKFLNKNKLTRIKPEKIEEITELCESKGLPKTAVLKYPTLLRLHAVTIDNYYQVMKEAGFKNITEHHLVRFRMLRLKSVTQLKKLKCLYSTTNVAQNFISYLSPCPENFHLQNYDESDSLDETHYKVLITYLKWRLNATDKDVLNLLTVYSNVRRKSFAFLCQNIKTAEELGFTLDKIFKYGYILYAYPKYVKELIEKYPTLGCTSIKRAFRLYPKFFNTTPQNLATNLNMLKEHNISNEAISRNVNVFHVAPKTLARRLKNMEQEAHFKVQCHHPNILKLVVHHNRAKSRLEFLKKLQMKCARLTLLGEDHASFDDHIKEGKDIYSCTDLYTFIKGTFKNIKNFEGTLKKHPYYLQVPLTTLEDTYIFLLSLNFSDAAIIEAIYILLYPREKIREALVQVKEVEENRTLTQIQKLNLILYFIEKEHHFTGDGVWVKTEESEHSEDNNAQIAL